MNIFLAYAVIAVLLLAVSLLIARYYLNFRFEGDRTFLFVIVFLVLFGVLTFNTLSLIDYSALVPGSGQVSTVFR